MEGDVRDRASTINILFVHTHAHINNLTQHKYINASIHTYISVFIYPETQMHTHSCPNENYLT